MSRTREKIKEIHFDFRNYSNFNNKDITEQQVNDFFECMPKELLALIEQEFETNRQEWKKHPEEYSSKTLRFKGRAFSERYNLDRDDWYSKYVPWRIRNVGYSIKSYFKRVFGAERKFFKWYYPVEDFYDSIVGFCRDVYTKKTKGYVNKDIWNFDYEFARLMVPRLIAVRDMKRHSYIRNDDAVEEKYRLNPEPESFEDNEVYYTDEEWRDIMNRVIFGFMIVEVDTFDFNDSQFSLPSESYWKISKAIQKYQFEGRMLFAKHFRNFAD